MAALLSAADKERIEAAVGELERHSALELVVAVVPRSSDYAAWRALAAGLWAIAAGLFCSVLWPGAPAYWAILAQLPVAAAAYLLFGGGPAGRWLVPERERERSVAERAYELFTECGVHGTRQGTGILLLLSEFEHRAVLLGDRAVHEVVGEDGWRERAERLIAQIRSGRASDGVLALIDDLSHTLSERFPRLPDDVNELPNLVLRRE